MTDVMHLLLVASGGAIGAALRWTAGLLAIRCRVSAWAAIMIVNTTGCLGLGMVVGLVSGAEADAFLRGGLFGGFTTFSTAMLDAWILWRTHRPAAAAWTLVGTPVLAVTAVLGGMFATAALTGGVT